ncbi:response regulator transcription factor [Methylomonas sp. MgM2]
MAHILIYSNNPQLTAEWTHVLIVEHHVSRLLNVHAEYHADAVIFDAKKLDDDPSLVSVFANNNARFLVLGSEWSDQKQIDVLVHGAAGYCEQSDAPKLLKRAVDNILKGDIWIRRALVPKVIGVLTGTLNSVQPTVLCPDELDKLLNMANSLSAREAEVANMIRRGENNKTIAYEMNISERTVKAHLSSIFRKFEVDDRLHLAVRLKEIDRYRHR